MPMPPPSTLIINLKYNLHPWEETDWDPDLSVRGGFQLESRHWETHQLQFLLEYYNGHSPHGQFFEDSVQFFGVGVHWYF